MSEEQLPQTLVKNPEKISKLHLEDILKIINQAKKLFENENLLLEFTLEETEEAYIIGDIHGNLESLLKINEIIQKQHPKLVIFLGDIVDRGPRQVECLIFILALKILEPFKYFILKGNHETLEMNQAYGFFHEFGQRFGDYEKFRDILAVYDVLPICAIINEKILCLHGGIPEDIDILKKLKGLKPKDLNKSILETIAPGIFQIIWNDPKPGLGGFMRSYRGPGIKFFGQEVFNKFMDEYKLKYLIRAHECFPEGYAWFFNYRLLSIFSSANYRGDFAPNPASYAIIKNNEVIPINLEPL
ncbi:MAG: serine/threonine protein phosphatase [Promethearchaeota archaeon]|nr:MAG: serine/threonine protein phosphatase [Candidatus Lokiarchaeota archaeon]